MAGSYFDFSTTPINGDIILKAKWCGCGGGTPEDEIIAGFYQGNGARVTNVNGTVGYVHKNSYYGFSKNSIIPWYANPDFSGSYSAITPAQIKSVEFGQDGTEGLPQHAFTFNYYKNIELITGVLTAVPQYFLYNGTLLTPELTVKLQIPSTATGTLEGFIMGRGNATGTIIFDCPTGFLPTTDKSSTSGMLGMITTGHPTYPEATKGFAIGGTAADYILANFPSDNASRNLYKLT